MDEQLRRQRDGSRAEARSIEERRRASLAALQSLIGRGRQIRSKRTTEAVHAWQVDCAAAINQLSGGSKAHWLSRAYSSALLVRSADGAVVVEADAMEIVDRILAVLSEGAGSLSGIDSTGAHAAPLPRQFEFVHAADLRPVLERAFVDGRAALERGDHALALILSCSVIESLLTDALEHARVGAQQTGEGATFEARIAAAERAGLIRGSCARLPPAARRYRDLLDAHGELRADATVSERDARVAGQVLRVVMRDLNPGR